MDVVWLEEAKNDLLEIGRFIAKDNPETAYKTLTRISTAADSLQSNPKLGRPGRVSGTRELIIPYLPYILPYYIKNTEVRILAVMHTARKWPDDFSGKT